MERQQPATQNLSSRSLLMMQSTAEAALEKCLNEVTFPMSSYFSLILFISEAPQISCYPESFEELLVRQTET